ncbi:MAG: HAD-superfamily hydrolase, subfamily variant 3 [Deltaproteobacteria bacterium]|nr:HAD-superfamily hydrolase, subfamily variant 3 [Deltaproteobacteria bacterium]
MLRAILFDYGGTLDGAGSHWLIRFGEQYQLAGLDLPFERRRAAFDHATQCAYGDPSVAAFGLRALVEYHVQRQFEHLGITDSARAVAVVAGFVRASQAGLESSRVVLARLRQRVALGLISNFYGNVHRILEEAGLAALFTTVIDSGVVGVRKPDPAIFALAVQQLGCAPAEALYVGDSFEKDMVGAHAAGLRTGWLVDDLDCACPRPECIDVRLRSLAELESVVDRFSGDQTAAAC